MVGAAAILIRSDALVSVGIISLLLITGRLDADLFWSMMERWWPMLLIGLGLIARRRQMTC